MKFLVPAVVAFAAATSAAALAEPVTRTVTVDTPRFEGARTTTRDREAGTLERDAELTRRSDGAVATHSFDRQRSETGATLSGSTTRFDGATRSFSAERIRAGHGYRTDGTVTGFNGESYAYRAVGRPARNGFVRGQTLRDGGGDLVAARRVAVRRAPDGGVTRRVRRFGPRG